MNQASLTQYYASLCYEDVESCSNPVAKALEIKRIKNEFNDCSDKLKPIEFSEKECAQMVKERD